MKNHVTFETAVRLKEAGFPQPTPEAGQVWYDPKDEKAFFVVEVDEELRNVYWVTVGEYGDEGKFNTNQIGLFVFAPTAADILLELESDFDISCLQDKKFMAIRRMSSDQLTPVWHFVHENPAEAAAQAFLTLKGKQ